jgi:hypothetical protein
MSQRANSIVQAKDEKQKLKANEANSPAESSLQSFDPQHALAEPGSAQPGELLNLQRMGGNQAVLRLLQTKLTVGAAGDRYEQEADRVADEVMSKPAPSREPQSVQRQGEEDELQFKPLESSISSMVQTQAEEEEELQTKPILQRAPEEEKEIQTKPILQRASEEEEEIQTKPILQRAPEEEEEIQTKPILQRAPEEEEEIQTKPILQRAGPEEEEEIQTKLALQRVGEEDELQTKPILQRAGPDDEEMPLQGKFTSDSSESFDAGNDIESRLAANQGGGSAMPEDLRGNMESRFGSDFSDVHIHTGSESAQLNRALSAQAFTHGSDIYMGEGKYSPGSDGGQRLLAHELTHVIQQRGSRKLSRKRISRKPTNLIQRGFLGRLWAWFKHKVDITQTGDYYVWKEKESTPSKLIISSHGGYDPADGNIRAPADINYYSPAGQSTDKQLGDVKSGVVETVQKMKPVPNYLLSKYQGYHGGEAETYQDVAGFVETNPDYAILSVKGGSEIKYTQILGLMSNYTTIYALHCRNNVNP